MHLFKVTFELYFSGRDSICSLYRKKGDRTESNGYIYCSLYVLVFPGTSQYLAGGRVFVLVTSQSMVECYELFMTLC